MELDANHQALAANVADDVGMLTKDVGIGLADHIVATAERHLVPTCDVLTAPFRKIPQIPPEFMKEFPIRGGWEFAIAQLRKRLRSAAIPDESLDTLEEQWWKRIEENLDEYEERFDEPHPARLPVPA